MLFRKTSRAAPPVVRTEHRDGDAREGADADKPPEAASVFRDALDVIETGAVLIDCERRVQFFNLAFRRLAGIEPHTADSLVCLEDLARRIYRVRGHHGLPDQLEISIADCVTSACGDEPKPFQFWLGDGRIIRQTCTVLDEGSRLLTYRDITEQTRHREEIDSLRAALDEVSYGIVVVDDRLRARFINKPFRRAADLLDDFADSRPSFVEILEHARRTNALHIPPDEIDEFIKRRLKLVREGRPVLNKMQLACGRVIQVQIVPLSGGGRLLTYCCAKEPATADAPELAPQ